MPSERFIPGTATLRELFQTGAPRLTVPRYQRRYAWNHKQEVDQLWQDLVEAHATTNSADEYFLGTIVLNRASQPDGFEIIDGQQRLATLTMIIAVIRNKLIGFGTLAKASKAAGQLEDLVLRSELGGSSPEPVLTLGRNDQESFWRYVQLRPGEESHLAVDEAISKGKPGRPAKNRVRDAFKHLGEMADSRVVDLSDKEKVDALVSLAEFILGRVTHITIKVSEDADAFLLFETVNDRGLDLSTADLLKNHLFGLASGEQQIQELTASWETLIDSIPADQKIKQFLRYFWVSQYERVTERLLYRRMKDRIKTGSTDPLDFLNAVTDQAAIYVSLVEPTDGDAHAHDLRDLSNMLMTQGIPLLMAARELVAGNKLKAADFGVILRVVETLVVRNTIVGKRNPNELERMFGEWARSLRAGKSVSDIAGAARKLATSDKEFESSVKDLADLKTPQARYLLRKIEFGDDGEKELKKQGVEVEHILPQRPAKEWFDKFEESGEELQALSQRLGNLTLLNEKLNKQAAAKPFKAKRDEVYSKSKIEMTKDLCSIEDWTYDAIMKRQALLAAKAKEIWRI